MKKALAFLLALIFALLVLAGCSGKEPDKTTVPEGKDVVTTAPEEDADDEDDADDEEIEDIYEDGSYMEGTDATDFTAELAGGGTFRLSDHMDEVVLLNFWATWCPPCVGEMPELEKLAKDDIKNFTMLAVNCREYKDVVDDFVEENGYTMNSAYDEEGPIGARYPTECIPFTVIINKGVIEKTFLGAPKDAYETYRSAVEECLSK